MEPTSEFKRFGFVDNVVFPTALIKRGDTLSVFYGAADTCTGVVEFSQQELLGTLRRTSSMGRKRLIAPYVLSNVKSR